MKTFNKVVFIGTQPEYYRGDESYPAKVFCKIEVKNKPDKR